MIFSYFYMHFFPTTVCIECNLLPLSPLMMPLFVRLASFLFLDGILSDNADHLFRLFFSYLHISPLAHTHTRTAQWLTYLASMSAFSRTA